MPPPMPIARNGKRTIFLCFLLKYLHYVVVMDQEIPSTFEQNFQQEFHLGYKQFELICSKKVLTASTMLFAKLNPVGKRKQRELTCRKKFALLKWMNYVDARRNYNYSNILCKTTLDRKTLRQMVNDI